ncbi:outer membrane beta-barrel protein [Vibrio barjaei]|uniref:outer membrane beta-barrel protein n=1 Tax=Vibrio barjaei TaxID=1676683 RepID=UPI002284FDFA|nr:outer membrane beta-barrel protein [Vibrio barjaei]MCY9870493.1 outer membrane beta-barrel protein [Vibrio barjaei]
MKHIVKLLITAAAVVPAIAQAHHHSRPPKPATYVGVEVTPYSVSNRFDDGFVHHEPSFSLIIGKEQKTGLASRFAIEGEYKYIGKSESYKDDSNQSVTTSGQAFLVNVKPRYYFKNPEYHLSGIFGAGSFTADVSGAKQSNFAFQIGAEVGTRFDNGLDITVGYKAFSSQLKDLDETFMHHSVYSSLRYNF